MKDTKKVGIWMDHFNAYILEYTHGLVTERIIGSEFTEQEKISSLEKGETTMNNKEDQMLSKYYKQLADCINHYSEILLFGPTDAKKELYNLLKDDHLFEDKKIVLKATDKMTAVEMHHFVKEYFK